MMALIPSLGCCCCSSWTWMASFLVLTPRSQSSRLLLTSFAPAAIDAVDVVDTFHVQPLP